MNFKLGKKAPVHDPRTLRFSDYLGVGTELPYIPTAYHWGAGVPRWPVYGNDVLGCCTISASAHHEGVWSFRESGTELIVPEPQIVTAYSAVSGYIPGNPSTDNGAVMLDVMNYWRKTGIGGSKLYAFAALESGSLLDIQASTYLAGGVYIGIQLPVTAQAQSVHNGTWSVVPGYQSNPEAQPGSWGGHCVPIIGYDQKVLTIITWGLPMYMTWQFLKMYADEAYFPLSDQWVSSGKVAPNKFNLTQLQADLSLI